MYIETKIQQVQNTISTWEHQKMEQEIGLYLLEDDIKVQKPKGEKRKEANGKRNDYKKNMEICDRRISALNRLLEKFQKEFDNDPEAQERKKLLKTE